MAEIFHLFNIKTSDSKKVYDAITKQAGLAAWWTEETIAEPVEGSVAEFRFTESYSIKMKIFNLEENKKIEWECIDGDEQWLGTKLSFEIEIKENSVDVRFKHYNWKEETELFGICNYHWGLYMKSLKSYIESGKGNPHKLNLS